MKLYHGKTDREFITEKNACIGGAEIAYQTVCRDNPVYAGDGTLIGTLFSYAYLRTDIEKPEKRPVLFAYNGGPGASAMWLHAGLLAPKRVKLSDPENPPAQKDSELEDNPLCMLEVCDIVLIDPVGTGYGAICDDQHFDEVFGFEADGLYIADFIENWLKENGRMESPKYLLGESYGTLRSCAVTNVLTGGPFLPGAASRGISVDGLIMMGSAIASDPAMLFLSEKGLPSAALNLPSMAAANWYHGGSMAPSAEEAVRQAYEFAAERYLKAVYLGNRMEKDEREVAAKEMEKLIGICSQEILKKEFRLEMNDFLNTRLADQGKIMGTYDARLILDSTQIPADPFADDPALGQLVPAFRRAFDKIAEGELGIETEQPYVITNFEANGLWKWEAAMNPFQLLQMALRRDRNLRVFFADGIYDMQTTIGQVSYMAARLKAVPGQVIVGEYPSGHMPYIGEESGRRLASDLRKFIMVGKE